MEPSVDQVQLDRRLKMAEMLRQQAMQPDQQQMAGGYVIPYSPFQGLAKLAQGYVAGQMEKSADKQRQEMATERNTKIAEALKNYGKVTDTTSTADGMQDFQGKPLYTETPQTRAATPDEQMQQDWQLAQLDPSFSNVLMARRLKGDERSFKSEEDRIKREETFANQRALAQMNLEGRRDIAQIMKAGTEAKPMTADQEAKFLDRWSGDYKEATGAIQSAQDIANAAKKVNENKGISGATGVSAYFPSYPGSAASSAEADLETLKGKVTAMGKAAMAASGSIGPMAVQEWKIVSDAVAALDPKKLSPEKLKEQISLVESQAEGMANRMSDVYHKQYQGYYDKYPQMRMSTSQKPPVALSGSDLHSAADAVLRGK
jgi:hypothetical protein